MLLLQSNRLGTVWSDAQLCTWLHVLTAGATYDALREGRQARPATTSFLHAEDRRQEHRSIASPHWCAKNLFSQPLRPLARCCSAHWFSPLGTRHVLWHMHPHPGFSRSDGPPTTAHPWLSRNSVANPCAISSSCIVAWLPSGSKCPAKPEPKTAIVATDMHMESKTWLIVLARALSNLSGQNMMKLS